MVKSYMNMADSELTATELRLKYSSMKTLHLESLGNDTDNDASKKQKSNPQSPISNSLSDEIAAMSAIIDTDLFCGLTLLLTEDEQRYISQLMTSGDVDKVAQGVQLLSSISEFSRHHGVTSSIMGSNGISTNRSDSHCSSSHRSTGSSSYSSRYPSTATATKNLRTGRSNTAKKPASNHGVAAKAIAMSQSAEEKLQAAAEKRAKDHWKRNPLPRRMPKSVTLDIINHSNHTQSFPLVLTDDEWDGTIADAFRRVQIDRKTNQVMKSRNAVEKKNRWGRKTIHNTNDDNDDSQTPEICEGYTGPAQRVVVASVKGQAAKKGVQVGDVVTHVNGERFEGSAADLIRDIQYFAERGDDSIVLVLNAEPATAAALSKRAFSLDSLCFRV